MLIPRTYIDIRQNATADFPDRAKNLFIDFVHEFEATDSWADFTNEATITLPRNIYYNDDNNRPVSIVNVGGFSDETPFFLKGDSITVSYGYRYYDKTGNQIDDISPVFQGFITRVESKKPFKLYCEDNMWKLKQIACTPKLYKASEYTVEKMLTEMLAGTGFTVNMLTETSIGDFRVEDETVMQVLERLRKDFHFEAYFRGSELRAGTLVYIEQDAIDAEARQKKVFRFQHNIIEDELKYTRLDDVNLSAVAYSISDKELNEQTRDGQKKTKKQRIEVLVYNNGRELVGVQKETGKPYPVQKEGERRTFYFWNVTSADELIRLAKDKLKLYYYKGFRGSFTTFAIPFVRQGDNVYVVDNVMPERSGYYKVKAVRYTGGVNGHRQEITLDYLIRELTPEEITKYSG